MKTLRKKVLFLLFSLTTLAPLFAQVINVSTGIDNLGNSISVGAVDPNWFITAGPGGPTTKRVASYFSYWQPTPVAVTNAGWINYTGTFVDPVGTKTFERSFTVAPGSGSFTTNFGVAWDDVLVSLELIPPSGGGAPISLTIPPYTMYQLSPSINYTVDCPKDGVWKIRAKVQFIDQIGAFILSGYITVNQTPQVCGCSNLSPNFTYSTNGNCITSLVASVPQSFFYSVQYNWTVNGSPVGMGQIFNYNFPGNGVYLVCLTVTATLLDGTICESQFCKDVVIQCVPCNCDQLQVNYNFFIDQCQVNFESNITTSSCMKNITYEWLVDGTPVFSGPLFSHTFAGNGTYNVCLVVTTTLSDGTICEKQFCREITITDCEPCQCDNINATFNKLIDKCYLHIEATPQIPECIKEMEFNWFVDGHFEGSGLTLDYNATSYGWHSVCLQINTILPDGTQCEELICEQVFFEECNPDDQKSFTIGEDRVEESLNLYPNPATNKMHVDLPQGTVVVIIDAIGRKSSYSVGENGELDIRELPSGMYMLFVGDKKCSFIKE